MDNVLDHMAERSDTAVCPACGSNTLQGGGEIYWQCGQCTTIYASMDIDALVETENDNPSSRNTDATNAIRLERMLHHRTPLSKVLDFGCGRGEFVEFLSEKKVFAVGVDKGSRIFLPDYFDAVSMVEVIEHLPNPSETLAVLQEQLVKDGIIYVESTFADNISDPSNHPYVNPRIGHRTILSRKGLDVCAARAGLRVDKWLNNNVVILRKV